MLVYFNRGVAGSQAYARKFHNQPPDKVPNRAAFIWLSRGLEEAMLAYIGQAKGESYGLAPRCMNLTMRRRWKRSGPQPSPEPM